VKEVFAGGGGRGSAGLNKTELAALLAVSVPTIGDWLSILEVTGQIILVPPYFRKLRQAAHQVTEDLLGELRPRLLSAGRDSLG
jgi:hypothetical protein